MPPQRTRGLAFVVSYTSVGLAYGASYLLRVFLSHWCQPGGFCLCVYIYIFNLHIWKHAVATWWKKRNHKMQIIFIRYRASTLKKTDASLVTSSQGFNQAKPRTPTKLEKASRRRPRHACTARVSAPGVVSVTACLTFSKACKATKKKERERGRDGGTMEIIN